MFFLHSSPWLFGEIRKCAECNDRLSWSSQCCRIHKQHQPTWQEIVLTFFQEHFHRPALQIQTIQNFTSVGVSGIKMITTNGTIEYLCLEIQFDQQPSPYCGFMLVFQVQPHKEHTCKYKCGHAACKGCERRQKHYYWEHMPDSLK